MTVRIAPTPRLQFLDSNGDPYAGALLFTYVGGTTTKENTYRTQAGLTTNSNPIVLDASGRTPYGVWLTAGVFYKFTLAPADDEDPPIAAYFVEDNISGINDFENDEGVDQYPATGLTPTYLSPTTFSLEGDQTVEFHPGRRLECEVTAGTVHSYILTSVYDSITTVTVCNDVGDALDSGMTTADLSFLTFDGHAVPKPTPGAVVNTKFLQFSGLAVGSTVLEVDDTIPQSDEGAAFDDLEQTYTPKDRLNTIRYTAFLHVAFDVATDWVSAALFLDADAASIAIGTVYIDTVDSVHPLFVRHEFTPPDESEITFKLRLGGHNAGEVSLNGSNGNRIFGGILFSSVLVEEIQV